MTDSIKFDFDEINQLAADLGTQTKLKGKKFRQAVETTARHVKDGWREKLVGEPRLEHAHRTITYDLSFLQAFGASVIKAEIGAERGRLQAPMVTVIEFGAPGNNTAPRGYGHGALQENQADFIHGLEVAAEVIL